MYVKILNLHIIWILLINNFYLVLNIVINAILINVRLVVKDLKHKIIIVHVLILNILKKMINKNLYVKIVQILIVYLVVLHNVENVKRGIIILNLILFLKMIVQLMKFNQLFV